MEHMYMNLELRQQICPTGARIRLLALDVDGTLFTDKGMITPASIEAIKKAKQAGITVIIASGRDYDAIPWDQLTDVELPYVVTTNGSALYRTTDRNCLYEECIPNAQAEKIFAYLLTKHVYMEVFMNGRGYVPQQLVDIAHELPLPEHIIQLILGKQNVLPDILAFVRDGAKIQKGTLNFVRLADGTLQDREDVRIFLEQMGGLNIVNGGFDNLEFNKAGVDKSLGIRHVCELLHIPMEQVAAIGDSENDIGMLRAAGLGIAMGNACEAAKEAADAVTLSNEQDGVAAAVAAILAIQNH